MNTWVLVVYVLLTTGVGEGQMIIPLDKMVTTTTAEDCLKWRKQVVAKIKESEAVQSYWARCVPVTLEVRGEGI